MHKNNNGIYLNYGNLILFRRPKELINYIENKFGSYQEIRIRFNEDITNLDKLIDSKENFSFIHSLDKKEVIKFINDHKDSFPSLFVIEYDLEWAEYSIYRVNNLKLDKINESINNYLKLLSYYKTIKK